MSEELSYFQRMQKIKLGLLPKESGPKPKKPIAKKSPKKIAEEKEERASRGPDGDTELQKFMKNAIKRMRGVCSETGLRTETKIFKYACMSIAHILPRQKVKSVQYHPLNWVELDVGMHVKFDKMSWEEREQMGCWPEIRNKLISMYDQIDPSELRHFPSSVREYIEKNEPF
jgi:hypothetical protein